VGAGHVDTSDGCVTPRFPNWTSKSDAGGFVAEMTREGVCSIRVRAKRRDEDVSKLERVGVVKESACVFKLKECTSK
jgi:hypothetical protein